MFTAPELAALLTSVPRGILRGTPYFSHTSQADGRQQQATKADRVTAFSSA
jgi:hypothetical protein